MRSLLVLLCVLAAPAAADPKITAAQRAAADDAFQRADWPAVAKAYEALLATEDHPTQRARYGMALVELGRPRDAVPQLEASLKLAPNPGVALYLARAHARLGDADAAFAALDQAVAFGGVPVAALRDEHDLAPLAGQARWKAVVARDQAAVEPCRAAPEYRQLDFWAGDWIVHDPKGNLAGTSTVQLILGGCTVLESWTGGNSSGKSFSFYDASDKRWHQTWVDDRGRFVHYVGGLVDGKLVITAEQRGPGKPALVRMSYARLAGGEVRQLGERSTDGGRTWAMSYDLVYSRRR